MNFPVNPLNYFKASNIFKNLLKPARLKSSTDKKMEIFHLGGTRTPSFNNEGDSLSLNSKYFYERIPIKTKEGEIHTYGNELKPYVEAWMQMTRNGQTSESFQTWMEKQADNPKADIFAKAVRYFNDKERDQTEICIENGVLMQIGLDQSGNFLKALSPGNYAFVIADVFDPLEKKVITKFYATPKIQTSKGRIQHSSFLRGGNIKSAGMLQIGPSSQSVSFTNISGHYRPQAKEIAYLVNYLKENNFDITKINIKCQKSYKISVLNKLLKWSVINQNASKWYIETGEKLIS